MNGTDHDRDEVPGYHLTQVIGSSGVATVHVAVQQVLKRTDAVKVFDTLDDNASARFEQLLRTNARLEHPNIVGIQQIGRTSNARLFHAMPLLVSTRVLPDAFRNKPLKLAALLRELLDALAHAHRRGIVHGGIKPSNVLLDDHGHALLADFGIARCAAELDLAHSGAPGYLSPEQARGGAPGQRSDLYAIGVLTYQLLTGSLPFETGETVDESSHAGGPVPRLPPMAAAWQRWIDKALAYAPEQRFQGAGEMADALSSVDGQRRSGAGSGKIARERAPKWPFAAGLAVLIAAAAVAGWSMWGSRRAPGVVEVAATPASTVATDSTAAQPASPTTAGDAAALAQQVSVLLAQANKSLAAGHLIAPSGDNAAQKYLAVLALQPGNPVAQTGLDAILATLGQHLADSWQHGTTAPAVELLKHGDELARHASPHARRRWGSQREQLATQVGAAVVAAARAHDAGKIAALKPLAAALPAVLPAGLDLAAAERMAATPTQGDPLRDPQGPTLVYVPASHGLPAFAIGRVEVTRSDYAAFVHATHRPASQCLEAHNPFSRFHHITWQAPGFAQGGNQPVVCVSWNDAVAYTAWLSHVTGEPYRLPSGAQWLRAARGAPKGTPCQLGNVDDISRKSMMDNDRWSCDDHAAQTAPVGHYARSAVGAYDMYGNVSEWLTGGSTGARVFRGLSWRDGSHQTALGTTGTANSDVGYTSVGFRVVRVIDAGHPPPQAVASH